MKRKTCIVTGSRAEYGLLKPLIKEILADNNLQLQLIVTGSHLSTEFGLTYKCIEKDGFCIDNKIEMVLSSDTSVGVIKSMGLGLIGFAESYERLRPDIVIIIGDRFEIFSAAAAALISRIPLAHISGGEITEGAFDDALRHSITKMSHLHFTVNEKYRKRVIQLGEDPKRVFNVGALNFDSIKALKPFAKKTLEKHLNFKFNKHNLLVVFHPATLDDTSSKQQFQQLLSAIDILKETNIIFSKTNADTDGRIINLMIDKYVARHSYKSIAFTSMGHLEYLSTIRFVDAVVGNSSSGISEAPFLGAATINIGDRQKGRIRVTSIIDCSPTKEAIGGALKKLYSRKFQGKLKKIINPYGDGHAAKKIKNIIKNYELGGIVKKSFYDLKG